MVTLRELQEALEEEVLTRQSLSRELEAIRTANQNFSRLGSRCWGREGTATLAVSSPSGSAHPPIFPQPTTGGRGPEQRPGGACSAATGADGDAAGSRSRRRVPHQFPARRALGGDGAPWVCEPSGQGRSPGWGTAAAPLPFFSLHAPYTSFFSFQLSRGSPVPGPRIHLPM